MDANVQPYGLQMNYEKPKMPWGAQLAILLGLVVAGFLIAMIFQFVILVSIVPFKDLMSSFGETTKLYAIMARPENFYKVCLMQGIGTMIMFALPAYFLGKIAKEKPFTYLGFTKKFNLKIIGLVIAISIVGLLLSGGLGEFTKVLPMTKGFRNWAEGLEKDYMQGVAMFTNMKSFGDYFFSLIMIAILPAIFEEIMFRGAVQKILNKLFINHHLAIFITAIVFSLVHFSVMGFLSRMMLGLVLGYVFYYGKNLWLNILMHFINNGVAVTAMYLAMKKGESMQAAMEENFPIWLGAIALALMVGLLILYKKVCDKYENKFDELNFDYDGK